MSFFTAKKPSTWLYILVWIFAVVPSNIVVNFLDTFLADAIIKNLDDINTYVIVALPLEVIATVFIIVFVYKKFPNLKISKVMPWMYVLTAINVAIAWSTTDTAFKNLSLDVDLSLFNIGLILSYFGMVLGIRYSFVKTKQWK